jgi:DivIVA domain-containing protein
MADEQSIGADDVARKQFGTAFRGFDQYEVRAFLAQVAAEVASLHEREKGLRERLAAAEERRPARDIDENELEAVLGAETTRVLHAAREAAAEIRTHAEESVARMLREANDEAARLRSEAESLLSRRSEEAEVEATAVLDAARAHAEQVQAEADATAQAAIEEAQQRGREMVGEAQAVRERILKDLSRKRRAAASQLDQLLAGRERLLGAYDVVRGTLDEVTRELAVAEDEARLAAEVAGFKAPVDDEPLLAPEEPAAPPSPDETPTPSAVTSEPATTEAQAPEPPPEPPSSLDDRRSSSLRLLRRKAEVAEPPPPVDDGVEGVRIIRPLAAVRPAPVPDPVAEVEPEPEPVDDAQPETEPEPDGMAAAEPVTAEQPVEDLFARIRADRAEALAKAEEVLAEEPEPEPTTPTTPEPEPEPEVAAEAAAPAADAVFERRDAALEPAERALTRALKRALADEQNEVLDALRRAKRRPTVAAILPGPDEHRARYASLATDHLVAGAAAGAASLGGDAPPVDEVAAALADELVGELRARLERAVDADGADQEALVETISATYRQWKTARSEAFARHHVAAAYARGVFTAAPGDSLQWVVDPAEGGCADCDDNALAGPTPKGEAYPTGQPHPPAHAGCRCLVLPAS